ncbi:MAG: branched-chain amino acid ABC transporter substrate-binding protein [Fimbriimonadales bacterium]
MKKAWEMWLGALALCALGAGCGGPAEKAGEGDTIKVGLFTSLTGDSANWGQATKEAVMLAIDEANAAGGVLGKKIELLIEDDMSTPERSKTVSEKLVNEFGVVALLGEVASGNTKMGAEVAQKAGIPLISSASTRVDLADIGSSFNRVCYTDDFQGAACARFALDRGWKNIALLIDRKNPYAEGLADNFRAYAKRKGANIVIEQYYQRGDAEFQSQLVKIKTANPQVVFLPGYHTEVVAIVRQARSIGLDVPFLGGDGWDNPELFQNAGKAIVGCFFSDHFTPDDPRPEAQAFVKAYQAKYGRRPEAIAALGYDSALVLIDAIKRAGTTEPEALKKAIRDTEGFRGATGVISIDDKGNARKPIVMIEIQPDGAFKAIQSVEWFDPNE